MTDHHLTPRARQVLALAEKRVKQFNHAYVGTEHILLGLLDLGTGVAVAALRSQIDPEKLRQDILKELGLLPAANEPKAGGVQAVEPWPDPPVRPAARPDSSFRHYLLVDMGTQWFTRIVKLDPEATKPDQQLQPVESIDIHAIHRGQDSHPFLANIYAREQFAGLLQIEGQSWGGWSLSPAEFARIKRLVELAPHVAEFNRLAAYPS